MRSQKKEWTITPEAFNGLLEFLHPDARRAAEEYEHIRERLMKLFRWRGCIWFEDYTDETIDRVARRIAEGVEIRTTNRYALFYGVAMNVIKEHFRNSEREYQALNELYSAQDSPPTPEEVTVQEEEGQRLHLRAECIRCCLHKLPSKSLILIKKYYSEGDMLDKNQRRQVAESLNISVNALRVRAFRIRAEVEECVRNCISKSVLVK